MSITDELLAAFEPWMTSDLADYLTVVGDTFAQAESVVIFDPDLLAGMGVDPDTINPDISYQFLLDPDLCPAFALPYLAQYPGERFPVTLTEAEQRQWIKDRPNSRRGTLASLTQAAARSLTGSKLVTIFERNDGTATEAPDDVTIITYTAETPDPARTVLDIMETFPLELTLHHQVVDGQTWNQVNEDYATWQDVKDHYATWRAVAIDTP